MPSQPKGEFKRRLREEARQKARPTSAARREHDRQEGLEEGRQRLLRRCSEQGASRTSKAKSEITYLLNNYRPAYDARIEHLIDEWRRSGDPSYDASFRPKLRQARRNYMAKSNPL